MPVAVVAVVAVAQPSRALETQNLREMVPRNHTFGGRLPAELLPPLPPLPPLPHRSIRDRSPMPTSSSVFRPAHLPPPEGHRRAKERERGPSASRGYGGDWRKVRALVLAREPLCRA